MASLIKDITDTAKWVAVFRAMETERPDAVFHDPFARRLAGEDGERIAKSIEFSRRNSWSFVARTFLFDEFVQQHVEQGYDMIVNLAAGLDARPYRMSLPASLKWIEVDLPAIIQYKQNILKTDKPVCELRSIGMDLGDKKARKELFEQLNHEAERVLIVTEGLISYLSEEEAGSLAAILSLQDHFKHWVFDMMSPGLLAMLQQTIGIPLREANAPLQFAPEEGEGFFNRFGWKNIVSKSKLKTAADLNRLSPEVMNFAAVPEPEGPKGAFPWTGVCLFENIHFNY